MIIVNVKSEVHFAILFSAEEIMVCIIIKADINKQITVFFTISNAEQVPNELIRRAENDPRNDFQLV